MRTVEPSVLVIVMVWRSAERSPSESSSWTSTEPPATTVRRWAMRARPGVRSRSVRAVVMSVWRTGFLRRTESECAP
ncbi:hypothetical protein BG452_38885 [Streptomyces sp. CBMA123]|nr:hypothetical protein [Streptomyces sp. CBMA123]